MHSRKRDPRLSSSAIQLGGVAEMFAFHREISCWFVDPIHEITRNLYERIYRGLLSFQSSTIPLREIGACFVGSLAEVHERGFGRV
jgi:hypothetical protein